MKKLIFLIMFCSIIIYGNDKEKKMNKDVELLYVIEIIQKEILPERLEKIKNSKIEIHLRDLNKNFYYPVGIIKIKKEKNKNLESYVKKNAKADVNGEIFNVYNELLAIDFTKCKLNNSIDEKGKILKGFPRLIKKLETRQEDGTIIYRGLAIIDKETYDEFPYGDIPFPGILKRMIGNKDYICPEYYNGE